MREGAVLGLKMCDPFASLFVEFRRKYDRIYCNGMLGHIIYFLIEIE